LTPTRRAVLAAAGPAGHTAAAQGLLPTRKRTVGNTSSTALPKAVYAASPRAQAGSSPGPANNTAIDKPCR